MAAAMLVVESYLLLRAAAAAELVIWPPRGGMIPRHLDWAFLEGRRVRTAGGHGRIVRRRLANLVLPTGRVLMGFPGMSPVNIPSSVRPAVSPGCYPVWASLAEHP